MLENLRPLQSAITARTAAPSAHARIREATRAAHSRAESVPVLASLEAGAIDRSRYAAMLGALARLFAAWEYEQQEFLDGVRVGGWRYASRRAALREDLADLGIIVDDSDQRVPRTQHEIAWLWGTLYVVEGAALGGQVLAASARRAMPGCTATRYLGIADAREGTWRDFCAVLDAALTDDVAIDAAVRGANAMFVRYEHALTEIR